MWVSWLARLLSKLGVSEHRSARLTIKLLARTKATMWRVAMHACIAVRALRLVRLTSVPRAELALAVAAGECGSTPHPAS